MSSIGPIVVFADVEEWAIGKLRALLPAYFPDEVLVSEKRKADVPWQIVPRRDGGQEVNAVMEIPRLALNVYGTGQDAGKTVELALIAIAILRAATDTTVTKVRLVSGPITVPDTVPRRLVTLELTSRGTQVNPTP